MTTVITRLYADESSALRTANRLRWEGFPRQAYQVISKREGEDTASLKERMERARVHESAIEAYADRLGSGGLLVIRATFKPLRAPQIARETVARSGEGVDIPGITEEHYYADPVERAPSVLKHHPRFMTLPIGDEDFRPGPITSRFGMRLLSPHRTKRSVISGDRRLSRTFWPMPLVISKRKANSAISGGKHMSRLFWPMPLVTTNPRKNSVIRGGAVPFSRMMGWPTISKRP